ncbi:HWE histidine kinase domain-containing protein [Peristeroidobacter agariperforans]|uniref:HWE histidine kinase domain-containing protein n=1 Tax=Peristeroidobacter agariperforans TaxID=268404 RepID=UPI0013002FF0|nr:HWE histidine kinase domain-containing protein [Peristeroidobacter agariperforans]
MTSDSPEFDLSRRLNSGLKRIASAHGVDAVLHATATAAQELANAAGLCAVPNHQTHCVISIPERGTVSTLNGGSALQRLITGAVAAGEAIMQHRPSMEVELPSGQRLRAETLLTVPVGADSGYLGLAFFWRDGLTPTSAQLTLLPGLAWTSCLALRAQQHERQLRESRLEQQSQLAEIEHRARNVLATVRSIIRRSGQTSDSSEDLASHLEARISALARTQGAMNVDRHSGPELEDLIRAELSANAVRDNQFSIAGPSWRLARRAAETIALTLHELTTNALKFGAFTVPEGRLAVSWNIDTAPAPTLRWSWVESNVHIPQTQSRRRGFGSELIERVLPYELGAVTRYTLNDGGAQCEIHLPINERTSVHADRTPL